MRQTEKCENAFQRRINELPERDKRLLKQAQAVKFGNYDVSANSIARIADAYQHDYIGCLFIMFRLGFLKGERKGKADMKKSKAKADAKKGAK